MFGVFNRSVGARLMALIVVMAMGLTGISVFSINEIHKNGQENEATLKEINSAADGADAARSAQQHFKTQVQEWKRFDSRR